MKILFGFISKKQIKEIAIYKEKLYNDFQRERITIENDYKEKNVQYELIKRAFDDFNSIQVIGIDNNKENEEVIIAMTTIHNSIDVYLYGKSYAVINQHPRIMATIREEGELKYAHIDDIIEVRTNVGNASVLMKYFIKICKQLGVQYICGWLSSVDSGHFERIEHFYTKFGFEVDFNELHTNGKIRLRLN